MKCPICGNELTQGNERQFEDLCDHVSDPNNEYGRPLRPTYICTKDNDCPLQDGEILWWDELGDVYIEKYDIYSPLRNKLLAICKDNLLEADNSFARKLSMQDEYNKKYNKLFQIRNFKWELRRNHICNETGTIIKYKFYIQIFKKDNPGWIWYHGFWNMLFFSLKRFYHDLASYKKYGTPFNLKDNFEPLQDWEKKDNYRKLFHWYVNVFHKKLKKEFK